MSPETTHDQFGPGPAIRGIGPTPRSSPEDRARRLAQHEAEYAGREAQKAEARRQRKERELREMEDRARARHARKPS